MTDRNKLLNCSPDEATSKRTSKEKYLSTLSTLRSQTPSWPHNNLTPRIKTRLEVVVLLVAVTVVLGLFAVPIIVQLVNNKSIGSNPTCKPKLTKFNDSKPCEEISWSEAPLLDDNSSSENYTGEICLDFLHKWQECATEQQGDVPVCPAEQQKKAEVLVTNLVESVDAAGSTVCQSAILPFVCQYAFPLCPDNQYLPSKEECYHVSTDACVKEWEFAENYLHMPSCELLPPQTYPTNGSDDIPTIPVLNSSNITCDQDFYENSSICLPRCSTFQQTSKHISLRIKIVELWTGWFGLICSIVVLIASAVRYKIMFIFPSVFLVYMTVSYLVVVLFVVITFFDQSGLYCSSQDLNHSIENPTIFCTISGVVLHYCLVNISLWWFFHVCSIFYKLMFPLRAKRTEKYEKYIHAVLLVVGLLLPLPAVIYVLLHSTYTLGSFPPLLCLPKNIDVFYYSTVLVLNVLTALGVCMFIPMFWVVHKHQGIFRAKSSSLPLTTAERKILFVLCYYALFGVFFLMYFGILSWEQDDFISAVLVYFKCHLFGENAECKRCFERFNHPLLKAFCYVIMSCIPIVNLVFVVNWKKAGLLFDKLRNRLCLFKDHTITDDSAFSPHSESVH